MSDTPTPWGSSPQDGPERDPEGRADNPVPSVGSGPEPARVDPTDVFAQLATDSQAPPPPPTAPIAPPNAPMWTPPAAAAWQAPLASAPFRPPRGLTTALTILIPLCIVVALAASLANLQLRSEWKDANNGTEITATDSELSDFADTESLANAIVSLSSLMLISTGIVFTVWLYRMRTNTDAIGSANLAPGWSIAACLIPCLNLFMPPFVVGDIWKGSTSSRPRSLGLVAAWGIAWAVAGGLSIAYRVTEPTEDDLNFFDQRGFIDDYTKARSLGAAHGIGIAVAGVFLLLVIRSLAAMQTERAAERGVAVTA